MESYTNQSSEQVAKWGSKKQEHSKNVHLSVFLVAEIFGVVDAVPEKAL
ncbi:hypothetical protein [Ectobacillus panaciterrae]